MSTPKHLLIFNSIRSLVIVLLIALLMPTSSALAQSQTPGIEAFAKKMPIDHQQDALGFSKNAEAASAALIESLTGNLIQDPSFESSFLTQYYWAQYSVNHYTPVCRTAECGNGAGTAGPRTGSIWGWFGGVYFGNPSAVSPEEDYVYQYVPFPSCGARLQFYLWIGYAQSGSGADDIFSAKIDNVTVFSANATQRSSYSSYKLVTVDVSSFANGQTHKLEFYSKTAGQLVNFNMDDVSLVGTCPTIFGNAGVSDATMNYTGGTAHTDASGNYSIDVPLGWSGMVVPSKANYVFSPANRTYSNVTTNLAAQNYTAIPLYSISGNVGIGGVTLSYTDSTPKTVTSQPNGDYSFTVLNNWSGTVTPTHPCFTFSPSNRNYSYVWGDQPGQNYTPTFNNAASCADIDVSIGGTNQGRFGLPAHGSTRASFATVNNGPVKINSSNAVPLIGAERVIYKVQGVQTSFTEMMGLPDNQLDKVYWLPWYNNVDLDTQLRFGNVSGSSAHVHAYIGETEVTPASGITLATGESMRVSYAGVNNGPVKIVSDQTIVAAERVIYKVNGTQTSFSEMMALPDNQLDMIYWLPWYNNVDLDTQLRIGNVSALTATVHVFIGGTEVTPVSGITLPTGASTRVSYAGVNNGPVKIVSDQNVVAAERVIYKVNGRAASFTETMALPSSQLDTTYWLPWYNNVDLDTQLRIGNVSALTATVHVFIGGTEVTPVSGITLPTGASTRVSYAGVNNGPVKIVSDQNVVAAERVIYKVAGVQTSFSEMMALPNSQLNTTYWIPWYNNADLDTQLRFGVP